MCLLSDVFHFGRSSTGHSGTENATKRTQLRGFAAVGTLRLKDLFTTNATKPEYCTRANARRIDRRIASG